MSTREQYTEKFKAELDEINATIDRYEAKVHQAKADARIKLDMKLSELRKKRDHAQAKLDELRQAGDGAWHDLKEGADHAWAAVKQAVTQAGQRFD